MRFPASSEALGQGGRWAVRRAGERGRPLDRRGERVPNSPRFARRAHTRRIQRGSSAPRGPGAGGPGRAASMHQKRPQRDAPNGGGGGGDLEIVCVTATARYTLLFGGVTHTIHTSEARDTRVVHEIREERREILAIRTPQWRCGMRNGGDTHAERNATDICGSRESRPRPLLQQRSASPTELQPPAGTKVQRSVLGLD